MVRPWLMTLVPILISFSFRLERPVLARLRRRRRAHENAGRRCLQLTVAARAEPRPVPSAAAPENVGARPSAPSAPSAPTPKSNPANGFAAQSVQRVARDADGSGNGNAPTVRTKPLKSNAGTVADDADANGARRSGVAELPPV
jgi:hypothetical protein